jgi:sigma-B regulation protein RsbU (phosphoserine phosphatase)
MDALQSPVFVMDVPPAVKPARSPTGVRRRPGSDADPWQALEGEFRDARQIQQKLFPAAPKLAGLDLGGACFPAQATGGDCFDFLPLKDGSLGVVIGDVSGHGFGPALLMTTTRAYLRAFAQMHSDVGKILTSVNRSLAEDFEEGRFVTLLLARLDPRTRSFVYASAGHSMGYLLDAAGAVKTTLQSTGCPLGIVPDRGFAVSAPARLAPGEMVVLLTDGIVEARSPEGQVFGSDGALASVRADRRLSAEEIVAGLYRRVRAFSGGRPQRDDITAVVIKALP